MKDRSRAEDIAGGLASGEADARLKSLRQIKNNVIGSKREKTKHLLYLPHILEILAKDQEADVLIQAAQAIGSFAAAPEGATALIENNGIPTLLIVLQHPDIRVIEASARALKLLFTKTAGISRKEVKQVITTPNSDTTLTGLLSNEESPSIGESAAWIIARCCELDSEKDTHSYFLQAGVLIPLIQSLQDAKHRNRQAASLAAITALSFSGSETCMEILKHPNVAFDLLNCVKSTTETPRMRFTACVCLTNFLPQIILRNKIGVDSGKKPLPSLPSKHEVEDTVLPVLVRLMDETETPKTHRPHHSEKKNKKNNTPANSNSKQKNSTSIALPFSPVSSSTVHAAVGKQNSSVATEVPVVLLLLLIENLSLQAAAVDADAILRLAELLKSPNTTEQGKISSLLVLGMLTETVEHHRRKLVDCGALPAVAAALTDSSLSIQGAACSCMKSLSRSTRLLRCSLGSLNDIAAPLLELSKSKDSNIATDAAATLANMAIEYSSLKEQVLVLQGIQRFVELTESKNKKLRLYGVWGLSSAVYLASDEIKMAVMKALPWSTVATFLSGNDQDIKEKTLLLLRNLAHRGGIAAAGTPTSSSAAVLGNLSSSTAAGGTSESPCTVLEWSQGEFLPKMLHSIRNAHPNSEYYDPESDKQFEHFLYAIVNLSSGPAFDKNAVGELLSGELGNIIEIACSHYQESIREAAVWVVINLTWGLDSEDPGLAKRRGDIQGRKLAEEIRAMRVHDVSMKVQERADTAWEQLMWGTGQRMHDEEEGEEEEEGYERNFGGIVNERAALIGRLARETGLFNVERLHGDEDAMEEGEEEEDYMDEDEEDEDDGDDGEGLPW